MGRPDRDEREYDVLVLMPTGRDAALTCEVLGRAGVRARPCADADALARGVEAGAGAVLLTYEALAGPAPRRLAAALGAQAPWSDLPILLFAARDESTDSLYESLGRVANVTFLERPIRAASLVSAVRGALRARARQYETRALLQKLEAADRQKDEFLATVSHELRTPLNSMLGWAKLLRAGRLDDATAARALDTIERNAHAQAQLVEDLLDVSRIISGKMLLTTEPVDLARVIEAAADAVRPAAAARGVTLDVAVDPDAGLALGDPARLQQVVWNLLSNAVKFTPRGGRVSALLERLESRVEITVRDTGKGIDPEFLPYVFDRFRQADGAITRQHGGLGLGLAITRHLVELHGGTVRVESAGEGCGATFTVSLPAAPARGGLRGLGRPRAAAPGPAPFAATPALEGVRVLVVDDEPDALSLAEHVLASCGAEVRTAGSAAAALEEVAEWEPDVIVSDIGMPLEDGYSLIRKVRGLESARARETPAIAATAFARPEDRVDLLSAGFHAHLPKPLDPSELVDLVASLARRARRG